MHVLVTRPEPDASALKDQLESVGVQVSLEPLLSVEFAPPAVSTIAPHLQALIATSRNALRALSLSSALEVAVSMPLFAVGPGTAELARSLGFKRVVGGPSSAKELITVIIRKADPELGPLLHLAGDTLAVDLKVELAPFGFNVRSVVVYRMIAADRLRAETVRILHGSEVDAVMLMSARTAAVWTELVIKAGLEAQARRLVSLCQSEAVAQRLAPIAPFRIEIAAEPNTEEMLALIRRMAAQSSAK